MEDIITAVCRSPSSLHAAHHDASCWIVLALLDFELHVCCHLPLLLLLHPAVVYPVTEYNPPPASDLLSLYKPGSKLS